MRANLNYQHLRYFWLTAAESSVTQAAKKLQLSPSTVSAQIKLLEEQIGHQLFDRRHRRLALTEKGRLVQSYADDIFGLGEELLDIVRVDGSVRHSYHMHIGVSYHLPKLLAYQLVSPAIHLDDFPVHLIIEDDDPERLVGNIATHHLDLILSDQPVGLTAEVRANCRLLMQTEIGIYGTPALIEGLHDSFPANLDGAPMLLPGHGSAMRREVEGWLSAQELHPRVVGEFGDSALMHAFGREGLGLFPGVVVMKEEICQQYGVELIGTLDNAVESIYVVVSESKSDNRAVLAVLHQDRAAEHRPSGEHRRLRGAASRSA